MLPQLGLLEMLIVMGVAVLLFGKRLPEVGRSLGRGIVEFKKGLNGVADELDDNSSSRQHQQLLLESQLNASVRREAARRGGLQ